MNNFIGEIIMRTLRNTAVICIMLITALFACDAYATTMIRQTVGEMSNAADSIIVGKVVKTVSEWNLTRTTIMTYTTIEVTDEVKGVGSPKTVVIESLGGIVGDIGQNVGGSAEYQVGEEVLVFVDDNAGRPRTVGMMQGKYDIVTDSATGEKRIKHKIDGSVLFLKQDGSRAVVEAPASVTLGEFIGIIKRELK